MILYTILFLLSILEYIILDRLRGPFDICNEDLRAQTVPALPYGYITTPNFPRGAAWPRRCQISITVLKDSWIGVYTDRFYIMPPGKCVAGNELQISSSSPGPIKHFCGFQQGLLFRSYMNGTRNLIHLNFISHGNHRDSSEAPVFKLNYICKFVGETMQTGT